MALRYVQNKAVLSLATSGSIMPRQQQIQAKDSLKDSPRLRLSSVNQTFGWGQMVLVLHTGLFLWPLRELPSGKMLEIGLGCDQSYGPGASARAWRSWLPNIELWEAEYNGACVEKTRGKMRALGIHPLVGDQANRTTLNRSAAKLNHLKPLPRPAQCFCLVSGMQLAR